jgi:hypothetical protein
MLAAADGHARNFSIAILAGGQYHATPLYDILSAHPVIGNKRGQIAPQRVKMAIGVRGTGGLRYRLADIRKRHWYAHATELHLQAGDVDKILQELADATDTAIDRVTAMLPHDFPAHVAEPVFAGLRAQRDRLAGQECRLPAGSQFDSRCAVTRPGRPEGQLPAWHTARRRLPKPSVTSSYHHEYFDNAAEAGVWWT